MTRLRRLRSPGDHAAALALGRRLVPLGFDALPVELPAAAFIWSGFVHRFAPGFRVYYRAYRAWEAGEEPMAPIVERAAFAPLPGLEERASFDACDFDDA